VLATKRLDFSYQRNSTPVISDLSLSFERGALTVITGPSGRGKSTLLYLLALMLKPNAGSILWKGKEASNLSDADRARLRAAEMGFVFQDAMLDPSRSTLDNVCESGLFAGLSRRESVRRATTLLDRFGVANRMHHKPGEISGGQAQRVALCRALLTRPNVIFGDEPTGNLDRDSADVVWSALRNHAAGGATVLVATHDERLAASSDVRITL
jgi:lipoprotein-releasing system ATP-binding protein